MNKKISLITCLLLVFFVISAVAQTEKNFEWSRVESDNKEFSISIPPGFQVFSDKKGFTLTTQEALKKGKFNNVAIKDIRYITASQDGAVFFIVSYKTNNLKDGFWVLSDIETKNDQVSASSIKDFAVKTITSTSEKYHCEHLFIGYKDQIYQIFGGAKNDKNEVLKYFFSSIKFNNESVFAAPTSLDEKIREMPVSIYGLSDTPFTVENEEQKNLPDKSNSTQTSPTNTANSSPLLILIKLRASYTDKARQSGTQGIVRLNVTFSATGNIEKISIIKGLPNGLNDEAVKAARLLRFLPQEKDTVPVDTTKAVEYSFSIY